MLHYAVVFFVIALIAAVFGFGGIAVGAAGIAKILFVVFAVLAVASFLFGLALRAPPRPPPCGVLPPEGEEKHLGRPGVCFS